MAKDLTTVMLGILTLLGVRIPPALKLFITALAIETIWVRSLKSPFSMAKGSMPRTCRTPMAPLHLQHALEEWSKFLILPVFEFFNAGIGFNMSLFIAAATFGALVLP